jgi:hypothetical protein
VQSDPISSLLRAVINIMSHDVGELIPTIVVRTYEKSSCRTSKDNINARLSGGGGGGGGEVAVVLVGCAALMKRLDHAL